MTKVVIEYRNIEDVNPYEKNPRKNDKAVEIVANSIKQFGFKVPIVVDGEGIIIAGHTRLRAAKKLGLTEVPVIMAKDLTEEQAKAFRLADNKTAEVAEWDTELLNEQLDELFGVIDMNDFGFAVQIENIDSDEEGERDIGQELGEADNYVVLRFDTEDDWEKALVALGIETVTTSDKNLNIRRKGLGRVINGPEVIARLMG